MKKNNTSAKSRAQNKKSIGNEAVPSNIVSLQYWLILKLSTAHSLSSEFPSKSFQ